MTVRSGVVRSNILRSTVRSILRGGGGAPNPLVFHAFDDVAGTFNADVIVGTGSVTEANTSTRLYKGVTDWIEYASGVVGQTYANSKWWVVGQKACTNEALYSDDYTNAVWVKVNGTALKDATGLDGSANGGSTLTATSANATFIQTVTAASGEHVTRKFVRRKTGTGAIELTVDGGSTWTAITITSAYDDYQIDQAAVTNPGFGIRLVVSGDEVEIGSGEGHLNTTKEAVRRSSPILTAGSAETINAGDLSFSSSAPNHDDNRGGWFAEFRALGQQGTAASIVSSISNSSGQLYDRGTQNQIRTSDGTNVLTSAVYTVDSDMKIANAYDSATNELGVNVDGTWVESAYDGTFGDAGSLLVLPIRTGTTTRYIRNIRRYDQSFDAVKATIDGLMA